MLIFTSTKLFASTPAQVQALIDNQRCEQALQVLVQEQQANTNKSSTIFDVLFINVTCFRVKMSINQSVNNNSIV